MINFLDKITKHKKTSAFIFLLLIVFITFVPQVAHAGWWGTIVGSVSPILGTIGDVAGWFLGDKAEATVANTLGSIASAIVSAVGVVLVALTSGLTTLGSLLLEAAVNEKNFFSYTGADNPVVQFGWSEVRDLSNMFVVLGFVIIGIAFTLRLEGYGTRKALITLILVALSINFSLVFCGIIIDGSNIAVTHFLINNDTGAVKNSMIEQAKKQVDVMNSETDVGTKLSKIGSIVFYNIVSFVVMMLYAFLFFFRHIFLWLLVILSPLAFACFPFQFTKNIWNMWWSNFFQWCIIGVPGAFSLWLASNILDKIKDADSIMLAWLPGLFLIGGFMISLKIAPMGASAVMGFAKGAMGFAAGAVTGGAGAVAGMSGLKGLAQRGGAAVKDKATAAGERLGLVSKGTTSISKQNRLKEPTERLEKGFADNAEGNAELAKIAQQRAVTSKQREEKASAAQILAKRNAFDKIDPRNREAVTAHATAMGVSNDTFSKSMGGNITSPNTQEALAFYREQNAKSQISSHIKRGMTQEQAEAAAMSIAPSSVNELNKAKNDLAARRKTEQSLGLSHVSDTDATNHAIEEKKKEVIADAKSKGKTMTNDEALSAVRAYKPSGAQIAMAKEALSVSRIKKAITKMAPAKMADSSGDIINEETLGAVTERQMDKVKLEGTPEIVDKFKKYSTPGSEEYTTIKNKIIAMPKGPERTALIKQIITMNRKFK